MNDAVIAKELRLARRGPLKRRKTPSHRRLRGNRVWLAHSPDGVLIQKLYAERRGPLRRFARRAFVALGRRKSSPAAGTRLATERHMLAHWATAGCDVPRDLTERYPGLAGPGVALFEYVAADRLDDLLSDPDLPRAERDRFVMRFALSWGARHELALERDDILLVHEHGTVAHALMTADRVVTYDFEQVYRSRMEVRPVIQAEIAAYLRSLGRCAPDRDAFASDLEALVRAYPRRELLEATVREFLRSTSLLRRFAWGVDRAWRGQRGSSKYLALAVLDEVLLRANSGAPMEQRPQQPVAAAV